jgi:hypothetical protein
LSFSSFAQRQHPFLYLSILPSIHPSIHPSIILLRSLLPPARIAMDARWGCDPQNRKLRILHPHPRTLNPEPPALNPTP